VALVVPADAISGPMPTQVEAIAISAGGLYDAAHARDWSAAGIHLAARSARPGTAQEEDVIGFLEEHEREVPTPVLMAVLHERDPGALARLLARYGIRDPGTAQDHTGQLKVNRPGNVSATTGDTRTVFDIGFWLTCIAAVPAGVGGALLGARAVDWVRGQPVQRSER
jgi:hypothetical protein